MKGFVKVMIAGAVILVLGIGVLVVALGINGWQIKIDGDFEMKYYECEEKNSTLDIEFSVGKLEVDYYDGETIKIEYPENENLTATIGENNGTLSFATKSNHKWNNIFSWLTEIPTTKIWIPQGDIMNLELDMNAGSVKLADGGYGNLDINMNAGAFSIGEVTCVKLSVELNAGSISAQKIHSIYDASIEMNAGSIKIQSLSCPAVDFSISAGGLDVAKLDTSTIDIDLSAGTAKLEVAGAKSDFNIDVDKSAGSCNISNQRGATNKSIKADVSAGTLIVRFES